VSEQAFNETLDHSNALSYDPGVRSTRAHGAGRKSLRLVPLAGQTILPWLSSGTGHEHVASRVRIVWYFVRYTVPGLGAFRAVGACSRNKDKGTVLSALLANCASDVQRRKSITKPLLYHW